jgi:acyl-lipid omega-6 desaturase (Delta-12 desaturase)
MTPMTPTTPRKLRPTNALGFLWLSFEIGLTAGALALTSRGEAGLWFTGQILLALAMWRWFVVLHTCGHRAFFRSRWLNDVTGLLASVFAAVPYFPWHHVHRQHHVWTGWKDLDPTLRSGGGRPIPQWRRRFFDFCWKFWLPVLSVFFVVFTFWNVRHANRATPTRRGRWLNALSVVWLAGVYGAGLVSFGVDLLAWGGLAFFLYCSLSDLSVLSQHVYLPMRTSDGSKARPFPLLQQDEFTRTMVMPRWASRWLFGGFNLHSAHHAYPWVPHYLIHRVEFQPAHPMHWLRWIHKAKTTPAHVLFLSDETQSRG